MDASSKPKQRKGKSKKIMIAGGAALLIAVALGVATQRIAIAVLPHTKAQVVAQVCTAEEVAKFNDTLGGASFKETLENIATRAGHESDASCSYMEYSYYMQSYNYTKARQAAERLESLVANGSEPSAGSTSCPATNASSAIASAGFPPAAVIASVSRPPSSASASLTSAVISGSSQTRV